LLPKVLGRPRVFSALILISVLTLATALADCGGTPAGGHAGGRTAPSIAQQPANQTVQVGHPATFSVVASGSPPLTYQWQRGTTNVSGATSASYTTPATTSPDNGLTYRVIVSNGINPPATSNYATLAVQSTAPPAPPSSGVSVLTYHNDVSRTGLNSNETTLTTANVNPTDFGKLGTMPVTGLVDAEPLYVGGLAIGSATHNVVLVATEHDMVYAFDADTFAQLWSASMLAKFPGETTVTTSQVGGCTQVAPEVGITSTPVIDPTAGPNGTIFLLAMSVDSSGNYHQRLHALDLATGADSMTPVDVQATYPTASGQTTFEAQQYEERAALLALNGVIYTSWTSHCDDDPYTGWLIGYSESNLQQTSVLNLTPNGSRGAVWMAGDGPAADSSGDVYLITGNGTFDTTLNGTGFPSSGDYGNAIVKISTAQNSLSLTDYFTMSNTVSESSNDTDFGSGGEMLLPDVTDNDGVVHHLAVGAGKDTNLYVVDRDNMGKFNASNDSAIYQEIDGSLPGGVWASPAYFNNTVYYGSVGQALKAFPISNAKLATTAASESAETFGYPGTTPSISANGAANGIVWAIQNGSSTGVLHAYDASNLATELYNSNLAAGSRDTFATSANDKFVTPLIANGKVYVGTPNAVVVFGLLNP
jgi:hypothetical protein